MIERISDPATYFLRKAFVPIFFSMMGLQLVGLFVFHIHILYFIPVLVFVISLYKGILTFNKLVEVSLNFDNREIIVNDFDAIKIYDFSAVESITVIKPRCIQLSIKENGIIIFLPKLGLSNKISDFVEKYSKQFNL